MSQINPRRFQIKAFTGMAASPHWQALTVPPEMTQCHRVVVRNLDGTNAISLCTDTADSSSVDSLKAGLDLEFEFNRNLVGLGPGEVIGYLQGVGSQPLVYFYE